MKRPGSNRGYLPSDYVSLFIMLLNGGGRSLEDTDRAFCLSVKRERIRQVDLFEQLRDDTYHVVATNYDPQTSAAHEIHDWYNQRNRTGLS